MSNISIFEIPLDKDNPIPIEHRRVIRDPDGTIFVPFSLLGTENFVLNMAESDGIMCGRLQGCWYIPLDWAASKNPKLQGMAENIKECVEGAMASAT